MRLPDIRYMTDEALQDWIDLLIRNKQPENQFIEYKQDIDLDSTALARDKHKIILLKEICSFANTLGGVIIYGIEEEESSEGFKIPKSEYGIIPKPGEYDLRLNDIIRNNISPILSSLSVREVKTKANPDKAVYVVYHPASHNLPHRSNLDFEYYKRTGAKADRMEENEIERAYNERYKAKGDISDYFKSVDNGEKIIYCSNSVKLFFLPFPVRDMFDLDLQTSRSFLNENRFLWGSHSKNWKPCDNSVITCRQDDPEEPYGFVAKIFPDGCITFVFSDVLDKDIEEVPIRTILAKACDERVISFLCKFYEHLNYQGQVAFKLLCDDRRVTRPDYVSILGPTPFILSDSDTEDLNPEYHTDSVLELDTMLNSQDFLDRNEIISTLWSKLQRKIGKW